jgi:hypothetical protein
MSNLEKNFDFRVAADPLFKIKFLKYYENVFNSSTPLWSQIDKTNDFVSKKLEFPVPTTFKGGVGSGTLPESKPASYADVLITSKRIYATDKVDRETIIASSGSEAAFVEAMSECIKKTVEADTWNHARILAGKGDGSLGTIDTGGVTDNGGGNYSCVISSATWKLANWEENMFVNFGTGTDKFDITSVDPDTRTIVVQRQAGGTDVPTQADVTYLQGSKDNDPSGIYEILRATTGTKYNVAIGRKWKSYQRDAGTIGISTPVLNKAMLQIEQKVGKAPDMIVTSYTQYEKILNLLEDQKRYTLATLEPKAGNLKGKLSFRGVEFMSTQGPIKIFPDRFCEEDSVYFLNTDHIKYYRRPKSGWIKDDIGGNGYLRVADDDSFEARFATYGQIFIVPTFHGVVYNLAV